LGSLEKWINPGSEARYVWGKQERPMIPLAKDGKIRPSVWIITISYTLNDIKVLATFEECYGMS
jgi:hypothetical protein